MLTVFYYNFTQTSDEHTISVEFIGIIQSHDILTSLNISLLQQQGNGDRMRAGINLSMSILLDSFMFSHRINQ
jgi:hypothetical protein